MAKSMVDRYRAILNADPGSMIFVELAKALLDQKALDETVEVCSAGVAKHTDSIVGQVLWGRALLGLAEPEAAMDHFDAAVAIDSENPYAYNLIGEALLGQQLYRSALPLLRKAVSLQPGDARVRQWLEQAENAVGKANPLVDDPTEPSDPFEAVSHASSGVPDLDPTNPSATSLAVDTDPVVTGQSEAPSAAGPSPFADPFDAAFGAVPEDAPSSGDATEILKQPPQEALGGAMPLPQDEPAPESASGPSAASAPAGSSAKDAPFGDFFDAAFGSAPAEMLPESEAGILHGMTSTFSELESSVLAETENPRPATDSYGAPIRIIPGGPGLRDPTVAASLPRPPSSAPPSLPPPLPPRADSSGPPPLQRQIKQEPSELFGLKLPPRPGQASAPAASAQNQEAQKNGSSERSAQAIAADYERELRARMIPADRGQRSFLQRNFKWLVLGAGVSLALLTATVATLYARAANRDEAIRDGLAAAHNGLARDSYQSYQAALAALSEVLDRDDDNLEAQALTAEAEAIVFDELDPDPARRDRASKLVAIPAVAAAFPERTLDARYHLLARDARKALYKEILDAQKAKPTNALLAYLAGRALLEQNMAKEATAMFQKALAIEPGHARTVLELARYLGTRGQWKQAADYYDNLRSNFPGHVRAQIGAVRAKVELGQQLDGALEVLRLVEKEHGDGLAPLEALDFEAVYGEVLEGLSQHQAAVTRLTRAIKAQPQAGSLKLELAGLHLKHFELPEALAVLEGGNTTPNQRSQAARLREECLLAWGRYNDANAGARTLGSASAADFLLRGRVFYHAMKLVSARKALEKTRNDAGKMPGHAAIYLALVNADGGEVERGRAVLERVAKAFRKDPLVMWAQGRVEMMRANPKLAARLLERALSRDDRAYRAATELSRAYETLGNSGKAMAAVSKALGINHYFREAQQQLAHLHLVAGEIAPAAELYKKILKISPEDGGAHRGLAETLLASGELKQALDHAKTARLRSPRDGQTLHTLGRVQLASGQYRAAAKTLLGARRIRPDDPQVLSDLGFATLGTGGRARAKQALPYLEEAVSLNRKLARAQLGLGLAQLRTGDKASLGTLARAARGLKASPKEQGEAYVALAHAQLELGGKSDKRRARRSLQRALAAEDNVSTRLLFGQLLLDEGRTDMALGALERAVQMDPTSAAAQLLLAKAQIAAKNTEGARTALEACLALSPQRSITREAKKLLRSL